MDKVEQLTVKQLYRSILKQVKTYPSSNRDVMRQAIVDARSRRLNIEKLGGVKPYSAHGY